MSTIYTELSTSDDQFTCFAHLLTSSHLHWQILVAVNYIFLKFCVLIVKKNLPFKGPVCNALCSSQMLCLYVSGCVYAILSTVIFLQYFLSEYVLSKIYFVLFPCLFYFYFF